MIFLVSGKLDLHDIITGDKVGLKSNVKCNSFNWCAELMHGLGKQLHALPNPYSRAYLAVHALDTDVRVDQVRG